MSVMSMVFCLLVAEMIGRWAGDGFRDMTSQLAAALSGETGIIELEHGDALVRVHGHVECEAPRRGVTPSAQRLRCLCGAAA